METSAPGRRPGGLVLFLALGMTRTAVVHLLTLFLPPAVLILALLAL
ncbi:hypothetical protein [Streptomyces sp. NPDC058401]